MSHTPVPISPVPIVPAAVPRGKSTSGWVPPTLVSGAKIMFIAEAPGQEEVDQGEVLVGPSGRELNRWLAAAGIDRGQVSLVNLFPFKIQENDIRNLCISSKELPHGYRQPPIAQGQYLRPDLLPLVEQTLATIKEAAPNIVVALGNTACWGVLGQTGISKLRGFVHAAAGPLAPLKILPTYHPAAVLRQFSLWPMCVLDLIKARLESQSPLIERPERYVYIPDTPEEILQWWTDRRSPCIGCDIETQGGQITCISFAPSPRDVLVVPLAAPNTPGGSYWKTAAEELAAWHGVGVILGDPNVAKVFHNGSYDSTYICRVHRIPLAGAYHDTMIMHHSMELEIPKSLANLGSIYTSEPAWKLMRAAAKTEKREDV